MTVSTLKFLVKPTANGELEIEVSPNQFKEPTPVEMPTSCMPGSRRKTRDERGGPKFVM